VCLLEHDSAEEGKGLTTRLAKGENAAPEIYQKRHGNCTAHCGADDRIMSIPVTHALTVCRMIHQEAALMPYQENEFEVGEFGAFETFIEGLRPQQSRAIKYVTIQFSVYIACMKGLGYFVRTPIILCSPTL
jgi:hypothetical protein